MSEVKVNKISPRTACGTVTLGDSGDTFTIPSGATITNNGTQTGFGRTGTVDWDTASIKTTGFTAVSGNGYFCNTNGGAFTATLPASPTAGDIVALSDYTRTFASNNLTIGRSSKPIGGVAQDGYLTVNGQSATFVFVDDTEGWININETQTSQTGTVPAFIAATGGTPCAGATCGDYKVHSFTGPGTLCVSCAGNSAGSNTVSYLVIGGGGGTGSRWHSGGGGAGGYREAKATGDPYTSGPLAVAGGLTVTASPYSIVVGGGGTGGPYPGNSPGTDGAVSSFSTITAAKGGLGGTFNQAGNPGGSGGGGGSAPGSPMAGGTGNTPATPIAQGTNGGAGEYPSGGGSGGGGGGATVAGVAGVTGCGGNGGDGATSSITGSPVGRAGGSGGAYGSCGGCSGTATGFGNNPAGGNPGTAGDVNTGAGGAAGVAGTSVGGAGGSGIVVIRYKFQ